MAASLTLVVFLHVALDNRIKADPRMEEIVVVPDPSAVRLCSLGYDRFLADMYWLRFVQYAGDVDVVVADKWSHAYSFVDLITRLDPHFQQPYWFGCWAIGSWQKRPDLADQIIRRGIKENPTDWYMPFIAGVNQYLFAKDYKKAADYYKVSSSLPGAPPYLARHAVILASNIPEYEKRVRILLHLYSTAKEENLKQSAYKELISVLKSMYKESPVETVRTSAKNMMIQLGVEPSEIDK